MVGTLSKAFFHALAGSSTLKSLASRYGMRRPGSFARRFIAGESIEEAVQAARAIQAAGLRLTLDHLGESVGTVSEADKATRAYLSVLENMVAAGVERNISLKLTQLGLDIDRATCTDNLRRILDVASPLDFFVRIDMENSPYTDQTFEVFDTIWGQGYRNVGIVLQSYLRRSEADAERLNRLSVRIRLVKGAYKEPKAIAFQKKREVDDAFLRIVKLLLDHGTYPAIATHDPAMIEATKAYAAERRIGKDRFEFQMLYGIRRDLQTALAADGYTMRIYVPFGREWFPYFMRRLGERPANVLFVLRGIAGER